MISELRVRDLATIADVTLPLGPGLNVLTGETGAGKSMLVDALGLLLGSRADSGAVRPGRSKAVVEGVFEGVSPAQRAALDAMGVDVEDDRLLVRREVTAEGRSRGWVNGSPATAAVLAAIGDLLVAVHGQHDTRSLLHTDTQRDLLDAFAGAGPERAALLAAVTCLREVEAAEADLRTRREEVRRRADYLRHVVDEIDAARLRPGEEDALEQESRRLRSVGQLAEAAARVIAALDGDESAGLAALARAERGVEQLERIDPVAAAWRELLDAAYANLSELSRAVRDYAAGLEEDPSRLAQLEARRDLLHRLRQKHGDSVSAVLETRRLAGEELDLLDSSDLDLRALGARRTAIESEVHTVAAALSAKRRSAAERLSRAVNRLLPRLGLSGGRLSVGFVPHERPDAAGAESVQYRIQLNAGMEDRPLARSASGGELSRLMLALEVVLARHDGVPSLVFDEVDQGVGGEVGTQLGQALAEVAGHHQVLVITHLPQIAARADRHLVVAKRSRAGLATSDVSWIHGEDRVAELARMLGDPDAETARRHALAILGSPPR